MYVCMHSNVTLYCTYVKKVQRTHVSVGMIMLHTSVIGCAHNPAHIIMIILYLLTKNAVNKTHS